MTPMIPPHRTGISPREAVATLWQAHQDVIGGPCPTVLLTVLAAQSALETGRWGAMWNWNWGNIRGQFHGQWTSIKGASEIIGGREVFYDVGPENQFRAYKDAIEGARDFVSFLGVASHPPTPNRYQAAWDAANAGDVDAYCAALQKEGYFTANLERYTKGVEGTMAWLQVDAVPAFLAGLVPEQFPLPDTDPAPPPESAA